MVMEPAQPAPPLDMQRFLGVVRRRAVSIVGVTLVVVALALAVTLVRSARYASEVQVEGSPPHARGAPFLGARGREHGDGGCSRHAGPGRRTGRRDVGDRTLEPRASGAGSRRDRAPEHHVPRHLVLAADARSRSDLRERLRRRLRRGPGRTGTCVCIQAPIDASNQKIAEAKARVRELKQRLAGASPREQRLLRAQIDQLEDEIAEAVATMVSLPTANPSAAVISGSAELPRGPANKNYLFVIAIATIIGLVLGVGIALFRERLAEPVVDRYAVRGRSRRTRPRGRPRCSPTPSSCTGARQPRSSRRAGCRGVPGRSNRAAPPLAR